ncbi:adenylate/guanylate cyclase domain-containing protein, partial [Micromonospora sp. NPDC003776]
LPNDPATALTRPAVEERLRRLGQRLGRLSADLPPIAVDQLLALLGYAELPAVAENGEWNPASPPPDAEAVPNAVADLLSALAVEAPLVIVVDDLHDATTETINALGLTLNRLSGPVLVLLLGRPELVRTAGALTRVADAEVHALPPLRGADASRLLTSYLAGGKLPQADADRLLATAQGNPFYLAELVTLLMERGALTAGPGRDANVGWRLTPGSLGSRLLSRDLAAVLAARIDALPPDARSVLRDAAVVGDTVPTGALEALREQRVGLAGRPSAVAAVELDRAVEELLQRRMLHRTRAGFAFATPLMREAAYAGVSKAELAERHAALARWAAPESADGAATLPGGFTEAARDDFVAEHVERASTLADAVKLRPDAPARAVTPL